MNSSNSLFTILFIGDIVGLGGRDTVKKLLPDIRREFAVDVVVANGENAAAGAGITLKTYQELIDSGVDVVTSGNHLYHHREFIKDIDKCERLLRPANYPAAAPGRDRIVVDIKGTKIGVLNIMGRVFMDPLDDPFIVAESVVADLRRHTPIVLLDMHAEATSEKNAIGFYMDGKVSAVVGTHTHIPTADEHILPNGTAFQTDTGMVGALYSIIGVQVEPILKRFLTKVPQRYEPESKGPMVFNAVAIRVDKQTGKAESMERIRRLIGL